MEQFYLIDEHQLEIMYHNGQAKFETTSLYSLLTIKLTEVFFLPTSFFKLEITYKPLFNESDVEIFVDYIVHHTDYRTFMLSTSHHMPIKCMRTIHQTTSPYQKKFRYVLPVDIDMVVQNLYFVGCQEIPKIKLYLNNTEKDSYAFLEKVNNNIYKYNTGDINLCRFDTVTVCIDITDVLSVSPLLIVDGYKIAIYGNSSIYEIGSNLDNNPNGILCRGKFAHDMEYMYHILTNRVDRNKYFSDVKHTDRDITHIWAGNMKLTALPRIIFESENIKFLDVQYNNITSLNLSKFPMLETLLANNNNLETLDLSYNTKLKNVKLNYNLLLKVSGFNYDLNSITGNKYLAQPEKNFFRNICDNYLKMN